MNELSLFTGGTSKLPSLTAAAGRFFAGHYDKRPKVIEPEAQEPAALSMIDPATALEGASLASPSSLPLGADTETGNAVMLDLNRDPHIRIHGQTQGSGKTNLLTGDVEDDTVAHDVREWAIRHGNDKRYRIALCGYDSEHNHLMPSDWTAVSWKAKGGYGSQGNGSGRENALREVVWFLPHCLRPSSEVQYKLFD